jgi:hypothetical protein
MTGDGTMIAIESARVKRLFHKGERLFQTNTEFLTGKARQI